MGPNQKIFQTLYRKLVGLYPRAFREHLGASMEQTFDDLWAERQGRAKPGWLGFVLGTFVETALGVFKEYILLITEGDTMKNIHSNPMSAAIVSFVLALPGALMFLLLILHIEPPLGPFRAWVTAPVGQPNVVGSLIALVLLLLLPVAAFFINLRPVLRSVRSGNRLMDNPVNFLLAIAIFILLAAVLGSIVVDQYPCWIGVPNCD